MNLETKEYIQNALGTESIDFTSIKSRLSNEKTLRLLHGAIGLVTESGEFLDAFKKHVFYGKSLDLINLGEEAGDMFWYLAIIADALGYENFNSIMETNIAKLKSRYGEKFSSHAAINRDLHEENNVLKSGL